MGLMYSMVVATLILCSMNVALKFPVEWSIFMREYYTGANALGPYFIGRTIADLPFLSLFLIMTVGEAPCHPQHPISSSTPQALTCPSPSLLPSVVDPWPPQIIPYWMAGLSPVFSSFINYVFIFFLVIHASASTGYFASSFSANPVLGLAITPVIATPMILFSGMLYERSRVPFFLSWMQVITIVRTD